MYTGLSRLECLQLGFENAIRGRSLGVRTWAKDAQGDFRVRETVDRTVRQQGQAGRVEQSPGGGDAPQTGYDCDCTVDIFRAIALPMVAAAVAAFSNLVVPWRIFVRARVVFSSACSGGKHVHESGWVCRLEGHAHHERYYVA